MTTGEKLSLLSGLSSVSALIHLGTAQIGGGQNTMIPYTELSIHIDSNDVLDINIQENNFILTAYVPIVTIDFSDSVNNIEINQEKVGVNNGC